MAFIVVYDACVLYPAPLRDLLMGLACRPLFQARWSEQILDECFRSILKQRPDLNAASLARTREAMNRAVPSALVTGHERFATAVELPDPDDRHVVAAAVKSGAQLIVTFNLRDFPAEVLRELQIEAQHPDDFVLNLIDLASGAVCDVLREQAARLKNPPRSVNEVLDTLQAQGLVQSVAKLRELLA